MVDKDTDCDPSQSSSDPDRNGLKYRTNCVAPGDLRATNTEADKQGRAK